MYRLECVKEIFIVFAEIPHKSNKNNYEKLRLVFDPGAAYTLIDTGIIDDLGYSAQENMERISSLDGAAGKSEGYMIKLAKFKCLDQELKNFEIACHDLNSNLGISGLLGMNFFKNFRMDINFKTGVVHTIKKV